MIVLTALVASALTLGSPNSAAAELDLGVAPASLMDDSDKDSDRKRGRGGDRGRRGRGNDSDHDSDRDSDRDWDRDRRDGRDRNGGVWDARNRRNDGDRDRRNRRDRRTNRNGSCIDINRDGRCDYGNSRSTSRPTTGMPDMLSSVLFGRGQRASADRWLPGGVRNVRYVDQDRNRMPERATFLDGAGRIAQVWLDDNRDGRADRLQYYQNGRLVRTAVR